MVSVMTVCRNENSHNVLLPQRHIMTHLNTDAKGTRDSESISDAQR